MEHARKNTPKAGGGLYLLLTERREIAEKPKGKIFFLKTSINV